METSPTIGAIAKALKAFQAAAPTITKDAKANYGRYASLGNVIDSTRADLAKHGLSFTQIPDGDGLCTMLMHESGEWIRGTANLKLDKQTPQGQGSAYTYARRYGLTAILGLATEDDDDGNVASVTKPAVKTAPTAKLAPKQDTKTLAAKDRILALLKHLKLPHATKEECEKSVKEIANLDLTPNNYERIGEALAAALENIDAAK